MQHLAHQLEQVRQRARWLLIAQRLAQAGAAVLVVLLTLGLLDFGLRLPGWLRGIIGGALLIAGLVWLTRRLRAAWRFGPSLSALALRVERLYPKLAGLLGSALEFALSPEKYARPAATAALAKTTVDHARRELAGVSVGRLIEWGPSRRRGLILLAAVAVVSVIAGCLPSHSAIAASRWLMPWSDTAWPKRTQLEAAPFPAAVAIDSPVEFIVTATRGHRPGMRVWMNRRWVNPGDQPANQNAAEVESFLMTEQTQQTDTAAGASDGPTFSLQWRAEADIARAVTSGDRPGATLEVWFTAGDDRTAPKRVELVARPTLIAAVAEVQPPAYAAGLVAPQAADLLAITSGINSVPMLAGSMVDLTLKLNKALPDEAWSMENMLPGLVGVSGLEVSRPDDRTATLRFTLAETVETDLRLTDVHGLTSAAELTVRFDALTDRPPTVTLLEPAADGSVLATAVLPVVGQADDDVGVRRLALDAALPVRVSDSESPPPGSESASDTASDTVTLVEREARSAQLTAEATLDLSTRDLRVGEVVILTARGRDVFELQDVRHEVVDSTPRRLRIIDEATFISQVRGELAGVRQQAERLERQQAELEKRTAADDPAALVPEQARLTRSIETQRRVIRSAQDRIAMNRLREPTLDELIRQADGLAARAEAASNQAQQRLQDAAEADEPQVIDSAKAAAAAQQAAAREQLDALAKLLDQGRDALGLKLELARLRAEQEALSRDTRELLPRTAGRAAEDLPEDLQSALGELTERQAALTEAAKETMQRLQTTAESLAKQGESDQERAAAAALAEAAAVAQRQGLDQQMQEAKEGLQENQLSQAGSAQMQSLDTLDAMMQELGDQDQLRQEMLRRRLLALEEKLKRLVEAQSLLNGKTSDLPADALPGAAVAEAQSGLWVRTIAVQTEAEADQETAAVAPIVGQAVEAQAAAMTALRNATKDEAQAGQTVALERLEAALKKIQEQAAEAAQDQTQQERAELRKKYLALAGQQRELAAQARALGEREPVTRRVRAELRGLAAGQGEVRDAAAELGERVGETVVFGQVHGSIDRAATSAAAALSRGEGDAVVGRQQNKVATLLESMAAALDEAGKPQEFAESSGGGGGGGGGAGQAPPLVPDAAELKLLRGVQRAVYDETRALAEQGGSGAGDAAERSARLEALAAEQRELAGMGVRLLQQMQAPSPEMVPERP